MMARKGNQQRNSSHRSASNHKHTASESVEKRETSKAHEEKVFDKVELPNGEIHGRYDSPVEERKNNTVFSGNKNNKRSGKGYGRDKLEEDRMPNSAQSAPLSDKMRDNLESDAVSDGSELRGENRASLGGNISYEDSSSNMHDVLADENALDGLSSSDEVAGRSLGALAMHAYRAANLWFEKQKPRISAIVTVCYDAHDYARAKIQHVYPIIWTWTLNIGKLMFLLSMVWLDCALRGLDSLLRMGTTSFFTVIWCSTLSVLAMIGISKMLLIMLTAVLVAVFIGLGLAIIIVAIVATIILWIYGSFWTTGLVVFVGGVTFALSHERVALLVTTVYSVYCARSYVGWLGLLLGLNLSFISSDVLIHFLKNKTNDQRSNCPPEQARQSQSRTGYFYGDSMNASPVDDTFQSASGRSADCSPGVPSTSGAETELTSEDEVVRLLNCDDHYSVLGLERYETIDASYLKREYRKKAMLVHPDKNMGNEKAAEAFKKLQNAYEVLLDSLKRKTYDDELRREELLKYFRRFQTASQKNGSHGTSSPGFTHSEADYEGPLGESRRIACKKCGDFHIWAYTNRTKSRARYCQDCKDFHQAKDGDGWVEQSFQPFLFGLLHKMEPPCAYVCAESRIFDATEWFVCQGMRCPANTHKASFHVNTSLTSKHNNAKGTSSASRGSGGGMPTTNADETLTEEEFFEWLQNAVQSGMFDAGSVSNDSPSARNGNSSKSSGKKKKKGKKQW